MHSVSILHVTYNQSTVYFLTFLYAKSMIILFVYNSHGYSQKISLFP